MKKLEDVLEDFKVFSEDKGEIFYSPEKVEEAAKFITGYQKIIKQLNSYTQHQRYYVLSEISSHFCMHCGSNNPNCQCWNDE